MKTGKPSDSRFLAATQVAMLLLLGLFMAVRMGLTGPGEPTQWVRQYQVPIGAILIAVFAAALLYERARARKQ